MLTKLSAVNAMLGLIGERPVNSLQHPHKMIEPALAKLEQACSYVQTDRLWFNTDYVTLVPDPVTREIKLPANTAAVDLHVASPRVAMREGKLYNLDQETYSWENAHVHVRVHLIVPFEDCPTSARAYIAARACSDFQLGYDGDKMKQQQLALREHEAKQAMYAEHIRATQANFLTKPTTSWSMFNIAGQRRDWRFGQLNRHRIVL